MCVRLGGASLGRWERCRGSLTLMRAGLQRSKPTGEHGRSRLVGDGVPRSFEIFQASRAGLRGDDRSRRDRGQSRAVIAPPSVPVSMRHFRSLPAPDPCPRSLPQIPAPDTCLSRFAPPRSLHVRSHAPAPWGSAGSLRGSSGATRRAQGRRRHPKRRSEPAAVTDSLTPSLAGT